MSEEESNLCSMCSEYFEPERHQYFCNKCSESTIRLWTCQRCDNSWSPDYCTEGMYSDCCHPMIEGSDVDIDSIKYCVETYDTVWYDDNSCRGCNNRDKACETVLKAYIYIVNVN